MLVAFVGELGYDYEVLLHGAIGEADEPAAMKTANNSPAKLCNSSCFMTNHNISLVSLAHRHGMRKQGMWELNRRLPNVEEIAL